MSGIINATPGDHVLHHGKLVGTIGKTFALHDERDSINVRLLPTLLTDRVPPPWEGPESMVIDTATLRLAFHTRLNTGEVNYCVWTMDCGDMDPQDAIGRSAGLLDPILPPPTHLPVITYDSNPDCRHSIMATCFTHGVRHGGVGRCVDEAAGRMFYAVGDWCFEKAARERKA